MAHTGPQRISLGGSPRLQTRLSGWAASLLKLALSSVALGAVGLAGAGRADGATLLTATSPGTPHDAGVAEARRASPAQTASYLSAAAPGRASAPAGAEWITSYAARIRILRDGSILVTEKISYDFGSDWRHGIFRVIPVRFRYNGSYDRIYPLAVRSVRSPDAPDQYRVRDDGSTVRIRIGDPNQTVTGQHTYTLSYRVRGGLTAVPSGDQLSWNAVGTGWDVFIDRATVQVSAPAAVTRAACFAGPFGSARSCQRAGIAGGTARFGQAGLAPHEGLTVVVAIPSGAVTAAGPVLRERWTWQRAFALTPVSTGAAGGLLAVLAAAAALILARRRRYGPVQRAGCSDGGRTGRAGNAGVWLRSAADGARAARGPAARAGRRAAARRGQAPRPDGHDR